MADDNSPTGGFSFPGSAGDPFKDFFGGNPTLGANPTQGPVTSNSAPSSGSSGTDSSSDGGGVGSDASSSSADAADSGASTSSQSPSSSASSPSSTANSGISSPASGSDTSGMGREGGGSWGDDMSITGGAAPDGRTSYSDPASGGLSSDTGPIGGLDGITGASDRMPVSLSSAGTSVADPLGSLKSALGISQPAPGATGTNFGTANSDPLASINAASWANEDVPAPDSIVDMGSIYNNPFRSPVGTLADNLPQGITAPKTQDRVPQIGTYGDSLYDDAALNDITPTFDGQPVASNIPAAPEFDPLQGISPPISQPFNNTTVAQTGFPSGTQSAWGGGPPTTDVAQNDIGMPGSEMQLGGFDPLSSIKAAMGIASTDLPEDPRVGLPPGGFPPASQGVANLPEDPRVASVPPGAFPASEIPRPADPLTALREAFGIETAAGRYPSRGDYQGMPYAGQAMVSADQTAPGESEMAMNIPGERPSSADAFPAARNLPDFRNYSATDYSPPAAATQAATLGSIDAIYNSPQYGGEEQVAVNWDQPPAQPAPSDEERILSVENVPEETPPSDTTDGQVPDMGTDPEVVGPGVIRRSITPAQEQDPLTQLAQAFTGNPEGGGPRNDVQQAENPDKAKIDELEAEIAALNAIIQARKAAKRSGKQHDLIMRNYS
jgi:hypothetical protein